MLNLIKRSAPLLLMLAAAVATAQSNDPPPFRPLMLLDVEGKNPARQITPDSYHACGSPDFAPDGSKIIFDTWNDGQDFEHSRIVVIPFNGETTEKREVSELCRGAMPSWAPDGKQFVMHTYQPRVIAVVNADGTGREDIVMHWGSPRWAPNGKGIFTLLDGGFGLYLFDRGEEVALGKYSAPNLGFSIAPDSSAVCFGMADGLAIGRVDWQTHEMQVREVLDQGICGHTSWSPDSQRVAFAWESELGKPAELYILDVNADRAPERVKNQPPGRWNCDVDWSPDGKWLVFASQRTTD